MSQLESHGRARRIHSEEIALAAKALPAGSSVLVLGAPDTGKTNLVRQIAHFLGMHGGARTAIVDADPDQQEIASPGTVGLLVQPAGSWPDSLRESEPTAAAFVGSFSPAASPLAWTAGVSRMMFEAHRVASDIVLIDTPSVSAQGLTLPLLFWLLDAVQPSMIVAISRDTELDSVLANFAHLAPPPLLVRVEAEPHVQRKSVSTRSGRRAARLHGHLEKSTSHQLAIENVDLIGTNLRAGEPQPAHVRKFIGDALGSPCLHAERLASGPVHVVLSGPPRREQGAAIVTEHFRASTVTVTAISSYIGLLCGLLDPHRRLIHIGLIEAIDFHTGMLTVRSHLHHAAGVAQVQFGNVRLRTDGKLLGDAAAGTI